MNFKYCVQLPPDLQWSEWRDIEPIPEKHILSIQYDKIVSWEESNAAIRILMQSHEV